MIASLEGRHLGPARVLWQRFYGKNRPKTMMPNCPECAARIKRGILEKYESETAEEDRSRDALFKLYDEVEIPMKMDPRTKHFICKKCGLYATREQIGDIRAKLNQREYTKEDRQYDYQEWWQKSKSEKQRI